MPRIVFARGYLGRTVRRIQGRLGHAGPYTGNPDGLRLGGTQKLIRRHLRSAA